ncbi:MAG TPA: rhodanese-like domain-containing protein [Candidatus Nanopelagicaceae bacterium]
MKITRRILVQAAVVAVGLSVLSGCSSNSSAITNMTSKEFSAKSLEAGVVTVDVRTRDEFNQGHISGAINIDVEADTFKNEVLKLDKSRTYAVYCQSGRRSGIATAQMQKLGFSHLFNLQNGISDWMSQGMPVVIS